MKYLPIVVFVLLSVVLTYQESPTGVLEQVKMELLKEGIELRPQWDERIISKPLREGLYGISLDMNAYARSVNIMINSRYWRVLTHSQKKLLVLHELMHSGWNIHHCYERGCVMASPRLMQLKKEHYDSIFKTTIEHHKKELGLEPI